MRNAVAAPEVHFTSSDSIGALLCKIWVRYEGLVEDLVTANVTIPYGIQSCFFDSKGQSPKL